LVQPSLIGASIIVCMFHTVTKKTLCDMLSTAVLCYIKNMFCIVLFVIRNFVYEIFFLEPSCNPQKHGGAWWCRWNTARRNSRWVQQVSSYTLEIMGN